jgi:DNA polymerase-3 subunit gamma/tau
MLGAFDSGQVAALLRALSRGDAKAVMAGVDSLASDVTDFAEALSAVLSSLQKIALVQAVPDALEGRPDCETVKELAGRIPAEDVQLFYQIGLIGRRDLPLAPDPRGGFEMALLRMLAFQPAGSGAATPGKQKAPAADGLAGAGDAPPPAAAEREPREILDTASISAGQWPKLVESLKLHGLARELASNCALREATREQVRLTLAPEHAQLLRPGVQNKLKAALQAALPGRPAVVVEVEAADEDTPAVVRRRAEEKRRSEAVESIQSDAFVQDLCKTFGAEVDPDLVQPVPATAGKGSDSAG